MKEVKLVTQVFEKKEYEVFKQRRRACAYARVSTDKDEQFTSYEAQVEYYTKIINDNPNLELVGIYTDEGISATSTSHRKGFNKMISDALNGKIDIIYTKSVSRFARNTVDSLITIRKLKEANCEVYFEKENIYTFDSKGELLITIMSSLAQEESRSISENITWAIRKRFSDGKYIIHYKEFLGFDKGINNEPIINKKEAIIVRRIYLMFLEGVSIYEICNILNSEHVKTPMKKDKWYYSVVKSILQNEKYIGDAVLQKTFSTSFLTKKRKINKGEVPKYYVKNGHPKIINNTIFKEAQMKLKNIRRSRFRKGDNKYSKRIMCGDCGGWYTKTNWRKNKTNINVWRCYKKYQNDCKSPYLFEEEIDEIYNKTLEDVLSNKELLIRIIKTFKTPNKKIDYYKQEINEISEYLKIENNIFMKKRVILINQNILLMKGINDLIDRIKDLHLDQVVNEVKRLDLLDKMIDYIKVLDKNNWEVMYHR